MENRNDKALNLLRSKAEDQLLGDKNSISDMPVLEMKRVMQELQLYHVELEMQNDELQQATIDLELQRIKFANLFELAPIGYIVTDKFGSIQDANYAALQLLGLDKAALQNKPFLLNIYKEDLDKFYIYFRKLFLAHQSLSCQIRILNIKKETLNVQIEGIVLHPASGNELCYLTIADFTEKQEAELKLKEAKKRLEIALEASLTGIWEIDIITGQVYLDDFCCSLYGLNPVVFNKKYDTLLSCIHQNDRKNVELHIRQTIIGEKPLFIRFRAVATDQPVKYIQARAQVVTYKNEKKCFIGTFTDISDKMASEMETIRIKEENQQMILAAGLQAEENEKKRISEVLHDGIAQTLYAIKLNIDQIKKASELPVFDQITDLLKQSIKEIRNISFELTPSILMDFGLTDTLEDMAARLSGKQLLISTSVINFSKTQSSQLQLNIFRIVQELVNNAIKHGSPSKISIEVVKKNKHISIVVSDNGVGFKSDADTKAPKGIGLSSIKNRLRLYKGTLQIEPNPAGGTTVRIGLKN
ncbi:MAG: PAS domain-containing sensor histidine kinase [Janthinobacterium lividum]